MGYLLEEKVAHDVRVRVVAECEPLKSAVAIFCAVSGTVPS
jgi:hypothetical protein